jgi:hypothetical protein
MINDFLFPDAKLSELEVIKLKKLLPKKGDASILKSGTCCVSGKYGEHLLRDIVFSSSTGNISNLAPYSTDCISISAYKMWSEPKVWARSLLATPGKILFPTISKSEDASRPTWRDALMHLDIELPRACILTTDPKKRIWPFAEISQGEMLKMYVHDPSRAISENRILDIFTLLNTISRIEDIYSTYGFSKVAIAGSLLNDLKIAQKVGIEHTINLDSMLSEIRHIPEFTPALIISQKYEQ